MNPSLWLYEVSLAYQDGGFYAVKPWISARSIKQAGQKASAWAKRENSSRLQVVSIERKGSIDA